MRFSEVVAASLLAPLAAAHGSIPGAPKIFGLPKDVKIRDLTPRAVRQAEGPHLNPRQGGQNGRCGPSFGNAACAAGFCCSGAGYCGTSKDHCAAPDCQFAFGPACDANKTPSGASTRNDPRPQKGNVPYGGEGIYECLKPGTVAITYDDGPYIYTDEVLNKFKAAGFKATFFVTGNNLGKGAIDQQWSAVIKRMIAEGHQVASHTWSHQDLSTITDAQRYDQMVKNEMAIRNIIGKYPTYMRPPYSSCDLGCQSVMKSLGYVVSYFDLDTDDYNQLTKEKIQIAKNNFKNGLAKVQPATGDSLAIAHDIHELTALNLTTYMIEHLQARGFKGVTMGECMNEPEANWYRTPGEPSTPTTTVPGSTPTGGSGSVSTDGTCGGAKGFKCTGSTFGNCCSQYGWCGSTSDHCGTGCNSVFGTCSSSTPKPTSTPLKTSPDGTCGGTSGNTCVGFVHNGVKSECCSQYGYCGNSSDHCSGGCNASAGICKVSTPSLSDSPISEISQSPSISVDTLSSGSVSTTLLSDNQDSTAGPVPTTSRSTSSVATTSATADQTVAPPSTGTSVVQPVDSSATTLVTSPTATNGATSPPKPVPAPTSTVSNDGKCGGANGQTCRGYTNSLGWKLECCSKQFGRCSNDVWSCGLGCNRQSGKCWF